MIDAALPPPTVQLFRIEREIDFNPFGDEPMGFRFAGFTDGWNEGPHVVGGRYLTATAPERTISSMRSIGSPMRSRTSAAPLDRLVDKSVPAGHAVDVPGQLHEVKRITGLSWERIGGLVRCTRQAVYSWTQGARVADHNREVLGKLHAVLLYIDRGTAEENGNLLDSALDGKTLFQLLEEGRHDEVKAFAGKGRGRPGSGWGAQNSVDAEPADHWFARLADLGDMAEHEFVRIEQRAPRRLKPRKG